MQSKRSIYFFIFLFQTIVIGCSKCKDNEQMIGQYGIEKKGVEIKDSTKGREAISFLKLHRNYTFSLIDSYKKSGVSGKWKIISCETVENNLGKRVPQSVLEFEIDNKKNKATYRDGRITFEYPEDLYGGRYKSLWYVKLNISK
ncbi:hypothetical protein [Flavobacterium terrae]|uniref:Lipoprotein n=1 Tax=Flavobacterium terrae TaxID=415425 RepID=A0A1M6HK93_9FLAO|nr:hypothetical protein [Flavobacterium terrae]SHJ22610.1 hypothetical protein SAMN05444363_0038 [Flavobacterium terrae]